MGQVNYRASTSLETDDFTDIGNLMMGKPLANGTDTINVEDNNPNGGTYQVNSFYGPVRMRYNSSGTTW